jgi:hypothetical protein
MLKGVSLSLLVGPVVPIPVVQAVLDALTDVEVTSAAGAASGFKLSFTLSNHSTLHTVFLLAATRTALMRVIIIVTINSIPQVLMDGVITNQQMTAGAQPGQTSLTIIGEDLSRLMDLQEFNGIPYPAMPQNVQVMTVLAKYTLLGVIPVVIPPISLDIPLPTGRIPSHEGTDLNHILTLAKKVGYVFYIDPGPLPGTSTAYWGPEIKVGVPQPALSLDLDAHRNVESLTFSFDSANTDLPVVMIQNPLTKAPIPIPIPNLNPLQPPLGLLGPPITKVSMQNHAAKLSAAEALGEGLAEAAESMDAVTARGDLDVVRYGHVLKSRKLVGVRGAGVAFDGLYYVKSVTSTIKRGEFKQSFELSRNGLVSITPAVPV